MTLAKVINKTWSLSFKRLFNDWPRRDENPNPLTDLGRERHPPLTFLQLFLSASKKTSKDNNAHLGSWLPVPCVYIYIRYIYMCVYINYIDCNSMSCFCMDSSSKTSFCLSALSGGFLKRPNSGEASVK